ncbi:unnamed protein product [Pleuronectes platessa]|uniref:Uncharacterized protein n=1 Tax=Pleuronectes platessa TaxID=8262 RepID=A0A9N7U6H6_PLEPL|nr:unnamed protein product [Pleuronectes platessa]
MVPAGTPEPAGLLWQQRRLLCTCSTHETKSHGRSTSVYGHPVTCLDASDSMIALGGEELRRTMHDGGNKCLSTWDTHPPLINIQSELRVESRNHSEDL